MNAFFKLLLVLAIAHLLAVLGFLGWLVGTGRIDSDRLSRLRAMFLQPIAQEVAARGQAQADEDARKEGLDREFQLGQIPLTSEERSGSSARNEERLQILMREKMEQLRVRKLAVDSEITKLAQEITAFENRKSGWEESIAAEKQRETDEQFRKAVRLIESMPPKQARLWILELVKTGKTETAVAYLDAMSAGKSANLLKSFKGDDETKVATELLERLRMLGLESEARAERPNAVDPAQPRAETARPAASPTGNSPATGARAAQANRGLDLP